MEGGLQVPALLTCLRNAASPPDVGLETTQLLEKVDKILHESKVVHTCTYNPRDRGHRGALASLFLRERKLLTEEQPGRTAVSAVGDSDSRC